MKRLNLIIEVDDARPDLLLAGATVRLADDIGGTVRSAYIDTVLPQTRLDRLLGMERTGQRVELNPPHPDTHTNTAGFELAKDIAA